MRAMRNIPLLLAVALALLAGSSGTAEPTAEAACAVERLSRFAAKSDGSPARKLVFVYFTPADRESPPGYRERLARVMNDVQEFYAGGMERHGLGRRSIHFDLDASGALIVHDVKGRLPAADYLGRDPTKGYNIRKESRPVLAAAGIDDEKETVIYFCHLRTEQDGRTTGIGPYYGSGSSNGAFRSGRGWFTDASILDPDRLGDKTTMLDDEEYHHISVGRYNSIFIGGAAHELGHALGLPHDKEHKDQRELGTSLMGVGNRTYGEERRGEGRGSFLTLADALRLASHPIFSQTNRDLDVKPECKLEDLRAEARDGRLEVTGRVAATPEAYALIAYNYPYGGPDVDAKGWHDYSATTWTAALDATNRFTMRIGEFKPGAAKLRFVVCHVNGSTSQFVYPLEVAPDGAPDALSFNTRVNSGALLLCGMDEVFAVDPSAAETGSTKKLWSWRARDHDELPDNVRGRFGTTDECKPVDGGKKILVSSSGGACALVERPSGRVLWYAEAPNAHSLEMLPHGRVAVASSVGAGGNRLLVFDLAHSDRPVSSTPLPSAHGVVWDEQRQRLWALGFQELRCYQLSDWESKKPSLTLESSHPVPDEDAHDLQSAPGGNDLIVSAARHVYLFDREKHEFRLHPDLGDKAGVKCVSIHPLNGRIVFLQGQGEAWWSDALGFLAPVGEATLRNERLYKARWLTEP